MKKKKENNKKKNVHDKMCVSAHQAPANSLADAQDKLITKGPSLYIILKLEGTFGPAVPPSSMYLTVCEVERGATPHPITEITVSL